jgi:hypothetical protein
VDAQRVIEFSAIAARFARVVTDAAVYSGQGIVLHEYFPRFLVFSGLCQR